MRYGYDYCVSIEGYKPTYTSYPDSIILPTRRSFTDGFEFTAGDMADNMASAKVTSQEAPAGVVATTTASRDVSSITNSPRPHLNKHKRLHDYY
jgi:hypothetical protein